MLCLCPVCDCLTCDLKEYEANGYSVVEYTCSSCDYHEKQIVDDSSVHSVE
jgi:hypothetical protein